MKSKKYTCLALTNYNTREVLQHIFRTTLKTFTSREVGKTIQAECQNKYYENTFRITFHKEEELCLPAADTDGRWHWIADETGSQLYTQLSESQEKVEEEEEAEEKKVYLQAKTSAIYLQLVLHIRQVLDLNLDLDTSSLHSCFCTVSSHSLRSGLHNASRAFRIRPDSRSQQQLIKGS